MEEVTLPPATIDVVLSSLAFHYVATFETLIKSISVWLKPGGVLVFSVEHPVYTAEGSQDWQYDRQGESSISQSIITIMKASGKRNF